MLSMSRQIEILDLMKNFSFHPKVSNAVLKTYCERKKIDFLGEGEYEDHLFQYQHDERAKVIVPQIIEALADYQYPMEYVGDEKREEVKKHNEEIEYKIAKICEDGGIYYREIDVITKNLAEIVGSTIEAAGTRMNNMCALVISTAAQEKFGEGLKVTDLAEFHRERAGMTNEE